MPQNNEIVAALPASGAADKELLREWAVKRNAFCLRPEEDLRDFNMIDPDGGGTTPAAIQNGLIYSHDEDDTTTAYDGVTCLVSADAQRYKIEAALRTPFNVRDKDLTTPPVSPSYGDAYLIYGSPTGAWAGKAGYIAIWTARGYSFALPPIGFLVYVRDETSFYHRNNAGAWTLGTGTRTLGANSVSASNIIGQIVRWRVENQTTNTLPASPSIGDTYICGPSWPGGNAGKIAICEDGSTFTIYNPSLGWEAYDKAQKNSYIFDGSGWVSAVGPLLGRKSVFTVTGSTTGEGSGAYGYSSTTAPTSGLNRLRDTVKLTYTARKTGATLKFTYDAYLAYNTVGLVSVALFRDSETNAIAWHRTVGVGANLSAQTSFTFEISASNASSHDYYIALHTETATAVTVERRLFVVEEFAS